MAIERAPVTMTAEDYATIRKVAKELGVITLKTADAFPGMFGPSRKGGAVPDDGVFYQRTNKDGEVIEENMRRIRGRERRFTGSKGFPNGIVFGFTDFEQKTQIDGSEWGHASRQDDVAITEFEKVEAFAKGHAYMSQREILAHSEARERMRQAVAAQPILSETQKIEAAARVTGVAMADALRAHSQPQMPPDEQMIAAGFVKDPITGAWSKRVAEKASK